MIQLQVGEEDLVGIIKWNPQGIDAFHRAGAHIENQLLSITQFNQKTSRRLLESRHRHS